MLRTCLQQSVARSLRGSQSQSWWASRSSCNDLLSILVHDQHLASTTGSQQQIGLWGCSSACRYSSSSSSSSGPSSRFKVWCQGQQHTGVGGAMQYGSSSYKPLQPLQCQAMQLGRQSRQMSSDDSVEQEVSRLKRRKEDIMRRLVQHEFRSPTLEAVHEPYERPVPLTQLLNPVNLFKNIKARVKNKLHLGFALRACEMNIPGHSTNAMPDLVASAYIRINEAQASYQLDQIKDLVGRDEFLSFRATAEERKLGRWDKIRWELLHKDKLRNNIKLVHGRVQKITPQSPIEWIQLTYRICSEQRFAAYKRNGNKDELLAGNFDNILNVEDYWVFEHKTKVPIDKEKLPVDGARWRLVKRLQLVN